KGRRAAAENLAFNTLLSADEATALLGTLPAEQPAILGYGMRAKDAPGGLVTMDPAESAAVALVNPAGAIQPGTGEHNKAIWDAAVKKLNGAEPPIGAITSDQQI